MRILVVDDEPLARARLKQLVEELAVGEVVGEAADGTQALHLVQTVEPDLLLLDIRMPGMDGIEVARHLARLDAPPAVVFTTAYDSHALAAIEASAVDYLLKPIRRERLSRALDRARSLTRAQLAGLHEAQPPERQARTHIAATLQGNLPTVAGGRGTVLPGRAQVRNGTTFRRRAHHRGFAERPRERVCDGLHAGAPQRAGVAHARARHIALPRWPPAGGFRRRRRPDRSFRDA